MSQINQHLIEILRMNFSPIPSYHIFRLSFTQYRNRMPLGRNGSKSVHELKSDTTK